MPRDVCNVHLIKLSELWADASFNCRGTIAPIDVAILAKDIEEHGLQQPIVVKSLEENHPTGMRYKVISGHRRDKAFRVLGRKEIPASVNNNLTDAEALLLNLGENLNREDLNIMQEATALGRLKDAGFSSQMTANELNKSPTWVQIRFKLLELDPMIQRAAAVGFLTQQHISEIYAESNHKTRLDMTRKIKEARLRGEKPPRITPQKRRNLVKLKQRTHIDLVWMREHIQDSIGNNFGTRCLAWATGTINDLDLMRDIEAIAIKAEIQYEIPYNLGGFAARRVEGK